MYRHPRAVERPARASVVARVTIAVSCAILVHQFLVALREGEWWYTTVFWDTLRLVVIGVVPVLLVRLRRPPDNWSDVWLTAVYSALAAGALYGPAEYVLSYADTGPDAPRAPFLVDLEYFLSAFGMSYLAGLVLGGLAAVARRGLARL